MVARLGQHVYVANAPRNCCTVPCLGRCLPLLSHPGTRLRPPQNAQPAPPPLSDERRIGGVMLAGLPGLRVLALGE